MSGRSKLVIVSGLGAIFLGACVWIALKTHTDRHGDQPTKTEPANKPAAIAAQVQSTASTPQTQEPAKLPQTTNDRAAYFKSVQAVRVLSTSSSTNEIQLLYSHLLTPHLDPATRDAENWLRDEMMNKVEQQQVLPDGWAYVLSAIYRNKEQDEVMRDYAVQHIPPMYDRTTSGEQEQLRQLLWDAVEETGNTIACTSLLALRQLAGQDQEIDGNRIAAAALKLAKDERNGDISRITAVRLCGTLGVNEAAPTVLDLAQNARNFPLRLGAIAALGDIGGADAQNFLQQIADGSSERLRPAALSALKRLETRLGKLN